MTSHAEIVQLEVK